MENIREETLNIQAHDGGLFEAYAFFPATPAPAPAVLVIQEIFGVNGAMREICRDLAKQGYLAVAPDLFWRQEPRVQLTDKTPAEWDRAMHFFKGFSLDFGISDLTAALDAVRKHASCSGKAGTMGYCLGGQLAWLMGTRSNADCNVSYYGVGLDGFLGEAANIKKPLLMHIAAEDKYVPPEAQQKIIAAMKPLKHVQAHVYPQVDHAFARPGGQHFNAKAALLANGRTDAFLKEYLQG